MKKLILQSLMIGIVSFSFAQKEKMISASQYLKSGDLVNAKDRIDIAVNHEKTKANPKAWFYRGEIYRSISKSKDTAISKLHANPYKEASMSYSKSMDLDEKGKYLNKNKRGNILQNKDDIDLILNNIIANRDYLMIKGSNATGLNSISKKMIKGLNVI